MKTQFASTWLALTCLTATGNEPDPAKIIADSPPADVVPFAGLSPQDACDKASLPPGFKMHVFAGEPDIRQPIAFCVDDRGRVWVAEGYTYPRRHGNPPTDNRPAGADRGKPTAEQLEDIFGGAEQGGGRGGVRAEIAGPVERDDPHTGRASRGVQPPSFASRRRGAVEVDRRRTALVAELAVVDAPAVCQLHSPSHPSIIKRPYGFVK